MIIREPIDITFNREKKSFLRKLTPYLFIIPHLIFFLVFVVYPFFYGIIISFFKCDLMGTFEYVGFQNYIDIFTPGTKFNTDFINGLKHTFLFTIVIVPLIIIVPLILALWLFAIKNEKIRGIFQAILYSTSILSVATVVTLWQCMMAKDYGLINYLFNTDINWIGEQPTNWIVIFMLTLWAGVGGNMIIFLSAIASIPRSQYEVANIDGISKWKQFLRLTLPSLRFPLVYSLVTGTIGAFNVFGQPYMLGGPVDSNETIMMHIQNYAFGNGTPMAGIASAMSVILGLIIVIVSVIQFKVTKRDS